MIHDHPHSAPAVITAREAPRRTPVFVASDDLRFSRFLQAALDADIYDVTPGAHTQWLVRTAATSQSVVIVDLSADTDRSVALIHRLRTSSTAVIIAVSAQNSERDIVAALNAGADDCMPKAVTGPEIAARIRATFRRMGGDAPSSGPVLHTGELCIDLAHRRITLRDRRIRLSRKEHLCLSTFVNHAGAVLSSEQLLEEMFGPGTDKKHRLAAGYVHRIRMKIEADPRHPIYLLTEGRTGYRLARLPTDTLTSTSVSC